jgi:hypothetical protein
MLRTGALPASISFLETRTVGPTLGATSIHQGIVAAIAGMMAVMIFMLVYYRGAGINADLALMLNLIILLGFMGYTGSTLTLPGIAGVILTIGMGVDSNVLIFERIREELRAGKTAAAAVQQGFAHAWVTIIDTHVTTIVSAMILFLCQSVYRGAGLACHLRRDSAEEAARRGTVYLDFREIAGLKRRRRGFGREFGTVSYNEYRLAREEVVLPWVFPDFFCRRGVEHPVLAPYSAWSRFQGRDSNPGGLQSDAK